MRLLRWRGRFTRILAVMFAAAVVGTTLGVMPVSAAEGTGLPGMCNGRSDANVVLNAHAHGAIKYILNVSTDADGNPIGVLILNKGKERLYVDKFCRVWQHLPGQPMGGECGEEATEGATIAHAVGIAQQSDGTRLLVRTDVRATEEGMFFRVRYRAMGGGHDAEATAVEAMEEPGGCTDEGWTWVPGEEWAPLDQLNLRVASG